MLLATVVAICPRCRGHRTGRCALALTRDSARGATGGGARGAAVQLLMGLYSLIPPLRSLTGTPWDRRQRPTDVRPAKRRADGGDGREMCER